jgi:hypothetical protein
LLREATPAADWAAADLGERAALLQQARRVRFGPAQAAAVQAAAQDSLGRERLGGVAGFERPALLEQITFLEQQVAVVERKIGARLATGEQHVTGIKGISRGLAARLLADICDISRFPRLESLVAYAGIDPTVFASGEFTATQAPGLSGARRICGARSGSPQSRPAAGTRTGQPTPSVASSRGSPGEGSWKPSHASAWPGATSSSGRSVRMQSAEPATRPRRENGPTWNSPGWPVSPGEGAQRSLPLAGWEDRRAQEEHSLLTIHSRSVVQGGWTLTRCVSSAPSLGSGITLTVWRSPSTPATRARDPRGVPQAALRS